MRRAGRAAIVLILIPTVLADLWAGATRASCTGWANREVSVRHVDLDELERLYAAPVLTVRRTPTWTYGVALPGVVILEDGSGFRAWAHEQAHQVQMRQDGVAHYTTTYATDWLKGRYAGCGAHDAYRHVGYEKEARELESVLERQWRARAGTPGRS